MADAAVVLTRALVPLVALLIVLLVPSAGRRPAAPPEPGLWHSSYGRPSDRQNPAPDLGALTVVQLRALARAAGHRRLARSGRRAELLEVLIHGDGAVAGCVRLARCVAAEVPPAAAGKIRLTSA